ncbi:MAG: hypothetical protein Q9191_007496 [Dirinaria sp. TL-2023a]
MDASKPDLLIGVDFGMTCTETASGQNSASKDYRSWFKTYLDPVRLSHAQNQNISSAPESMEEVEKWYEDYLRWLYRHIEFKLGPEIQGTSWHGATIEFIFSVPTTWRPPVVESFRSIILRAGFQGYPGHSVTIGLTEAEAAAVHTSIEACGIFQFLIVDDVMKERDVLMVCDAGGGTTNSFNSAVGATIGSAAIDRGFQQVVERRLERAYGDVKLKATVEEAAWEVMKSQDFQNTKCEHGGLDDTPMFSVPIPKLESSYEDSGAGIGNGEMTFAREDLQALFDEQVQKLISLIESQLQNMQRKFPSVQVAHLVLSGGLGHSPYVQKQLRARYNNGGGHYNARGLQVRIAPEPQLAVCKGILADRVRKLKAGKPVISYRCCRASYGTICKELYSKNNPQHQGRQTFVDPMNGKLYVTESIAWFIVKGQPVSAEQPITHHFTRKMQPGDPRRAFPTSVVVSHADKESLPHHMGPDAHILCEVHSDLSSADEKQFKRKNRHFWNTGKIYYKVDYEVKVLIGPADIRFELWFNGQKLNKDERITVEWATVTESVPDPATPLWDQWDQEPVWKLGSSKSAINLRSSIQDIVHRGSAKPPRNSKEDTGAHKALSSIGSISIDNGKDSPGSIATSSPIELAGNGPPGDASYYPAGRKELP